MTVFAELIKGVAIIYLVLIALFGILATWLNNTRRRP